MTNGGKIREVAGLFLKLGLTAFGGPAAHLSMMLEEVVSKRKWMREEHFLDLMGATNLIPGPNSTEMAMHIGHERAGWPGLIVAGLCFVFPAVVLTGILAWLYKQYGQLPVVQPFVYGIKPAIIAIILAAIFPLARKSLKTMRLALIGLAVLILSLFSFNEIYLMFGAGLLAVALDSVSRNSTTARFFVPLALIQLFVATTVHAGNLRLFWIFLKVGAILYGSGYVLFAFLDAEFVATGLLTRQQLIDAIAAGQLTPGPVTSSVTFVGYQINGWTGAAVSTVGIFLPSFLFVALLNPMVKKMRDSKRFSTFLDAVNVASVALIVSVCYAMAMDVITGWRTILIAVISISITFGWKKINSIWIVLGGSLAGYGLSLV
jgi:chromate transporter